MRHAPRTTPHPHSALGNHLARALGDTTPLLRCARCETLCSGDVPFVGLALPNGVSAGVSCFDCLSDGELVDFLDRVDLATYLFGDTTTKVEAVVDCA